MAELSENTFIDLVNRNIGIAHKVCRIYIDDPDDREDVMQEMMYQLWRSYPSFDNRSKFSTWMYSVCLNTALVYRKKNIKKERVGLEKKHNQIMDQSAHDMEEKYALLFEAISTLNPVNKAIILLYLDELSYDEIAEITGLTKSNISVRLVRMKKELETKMKDNLNIN